MRRRAVLIDDDELLLAGLRRSLHVERDKYDLEFHVNPVDALAACEDRPPDIAVVDLHMPDMSGIEVLAELRRRAPASQLILLSGYCDLAAAKRAINELRVFGVVDKPCTTKDISNWLACAAAALPKPALQLHQAPSLTLKACSGQLIDANPAGQALLAQRDGIYVDAAGLCRAADRTATARFFNFISQREANTRFLALPRPSGRRDLALALRAAPTNTDIAVLSVREPDRAWDIEPAMLVSLFGLTPSEAALVSQLIVHHDLLAASNACHLTETSARTYLKRIFSKMNVRRQTELISLVFSAGGAS